MKFLHTADWQLGKPFARISDPDKAAKVRAERIEAIRRLGALVKEHKSDFVVVAGDLFDSFTAEKSVVSAACSAMGKIGVPVLAIPGNHDHGGPGGLWEQDFFRQECESLAPNFRILLERKPVELEGATIFPCPLLRQHESADPTTWVRDFDFASLSHPDQPRILLAHGSVHGFESNSGDDEDGSAGTSNLIALDRLPRAELDFIALGDWHGTKAIDPAAWYSGTPETDRFPKGENNDPGNALLVEVARGKEADVKKVPTGKLGWQVLDFTFASDEDVNRLEEQLRDLLGTRAGEDLLQLTLEGSLSIAAASRLDDLLSTFEARLLRLKEKNLIRLTPSEEEVESLANRPGDPLISKVAEGLFASAAGTGEEAEVARIALRELYAACSA
ncbi:MAG: DNA repair exonuclease [Verrucomicrobiales bacterium]|nr:DNA repair exonuclease [Verrucomicrobiales bacterium]